MAKEKDSYFRKDLLNHLRGFCMVVQNDCSLTKAGDKTGIEPGTLSRQIIALEKDIDINLFDRTNRRVLTLTYEGRLFYEDAVIKLQAIEGLFENYSTNVIEAKRRNDLRIASFDGVLEKIIPYLAKFKEQKPEINISLFNITKEKAYQRIINNEIDLAFYVSDINEWFPKELEKIEISKYLEYWIMYPEHPLAKKKESEITRELVASYPFGVLPGIAFTKSFQTFVNEYNLKSPIYLENGTLNMLKKMIKAKICISSVDKTYITEKDKQDFVFKDTASCMPQRFYHYFHKKGKIFNDIIGGFLDIVKENREKIFH